MLHLEKLRNLNITLSDPANPSQLSISQLSTPWTAGVERKLGNMKHSKILFPRVRLLIKYQGRPTTTIAVGDPLDFKLETQEGRNLLQDIFATNVIARDPYSDRFVELIDGNGCPVDPYVFPTLGLSR